jgi:hypothetical protein
MGAMCVLLQDSRIRLAPGGSPWHAALLTNELMNTVVVFTRRVFGGDTSMFCKQCDWWGPREC